MLTQEQMFQQQLGAIIVTLGPVTKETAKDRIEILLILAVEWLGNFPQVKIDPRLAVQLNTYLKFDSSLVSRLHEMEIHPDYMYASREYPRKYAGESYPPEGEGWVANTYKDNGVTRYDNTEDHWWMRLKSDAKKDPIKIESLKPVTLEPVQLCDYLTLLFERVNKVYLPLNISIVELQAFGVAGLENWQQAYRKWETLRRPEFNSKPKYITDGSFLYQLEPGYVCLQPNFVYSLDKSINDNGEEAKTDQIYFYVETVEGVSILSDLSDPLHNTFLRIRQQDGLPGQFTRWNKFFNLCINPYALAEAVNQAG